MQAVLTGWKEIAQYVRRGVRTVQRWEYEFSFPVHRASNGSHHTVLAVPSEIDEWVRRQERTATSAELEECRDEVARLKNEIRRSPNLRDL
jgi:hypothetical protein